MISRLAATLAAGALVATGLATSATAAAPFTDTVRIVGNYDTGNHGYWASLAYSRTVSITERVEGDVYDVVLSDRGTFRTLPGARSPQAGERIRNVQNGTFDGSFSYVVTSEAEPTAERVARFHNFRCNPRVPNRGDCPGMDAPTSNWPALYFPQGATVTPGAWRWEYRTCAERWVNGSGGNAGDITGKRCDRTVRADEPTVVQPECDATRGKLTVPADRGVRYEVNGRTWRAGSYDVRSGVYRVTAHARDGYRLVGDQRWRLTVERAVACPTPTPTPTVTPTVTVSPTPTADPNPEAVTPAAPKLTQATCDDKTASIAIPDVEGVVYKGGSGTVLEPGKTYSAKPGNAVVTAEAADGYVLAEGAKTEWTFVVSDAPEDCPTATPTVTTTTPVVVVNNIPVPSRVDTGLGGLARR